MVLRNGFADSLIRETHHPSRRPSSVLLPCRIRSSDCRLFPSRTIGSMFEKIDLLSRNYKRVRPIHHRDIIARESFDHKKEQYNEAHRKRGDRGSAMLVLHQGNELCLQRTPRQRGADGRLQTVYVQADVPRLGEVCRGILGTRPYRREPFPCRDHQRASS